MKRFMKGVVAAGLTLVTLLAVAVGLSWAWRARPLGEIDVDASQELQHAQSHGIAYLKHAGKTLRLTATVLDQQDGVLHVELPQTPQRVAVDCLLAAEEPRARGPVPGDTVAMRGRLSGDDTHPVLFLEQCVIESSDG